MTRWHAAVLSVLTSAGTGALAQAQDEQPSGVETADQKQKQTSFAIELFGEYLSGADVDGDPGDVDVARAGGEISVRHAVNPRLALTGSFRHEVSDYDFESAGGLFPGSTDDESPFDDVRESRFALGFAYGIDEFWSVFGTGFVGAGYESGADFDDALYGGGFAGFGYAFNEAFSLQLGIGVRTRLEDSTLVIPLIGFRWQISDTVSLESEGISARLAWQTNDELELSLFARYTTRDYRTVDNNQYLPDGVFSDDRVVIGARADWEPAPLFSLTLEAGASVWQEFTFYDSDGDEISDSDTDIQFVLGAAIEFRF